MDDRETPFSVRLLGARRSLEFGALVAEESRGEFIRRAVQERADRLIERARREGRVDEDRIRPGGRRE